MGPLWGFSESWDLQRGPSGWPSVLETVGWLGMWMSPACSVETVPPVLRAEEDAGKGPTWESGPL